MARNSRIPSTRVFNGGFAKPLPATGKVSLKWKPRLKADPATERANGSHRPVEERPLHPFFSYQA
jgi:hypothetical protein